MKKLTYALLLCVSILFLCGCAASSKFVRIKQFPDGEQVNIIIGGFLSGIKDVNVVENTYSAPYEKVWSAVKNVAQNFSKVGKRPIVGIDEANGRVQNGKISEDALIGLGVGAWLDEFVMEATSLSESKTKVAVSRKVVQVSLPDKVTLRKEAKTQYSNGKIESWLLSQIEDELKKEEVKK